ncbi:MAG: glycosyltransferase family 4 protein [Pirellulaceae bacterium]|nr:glycosyltransferase family 4 protein [Planctomycetales bacterium]
MTNLVDDESAVGTRLSRPPAVLLQYLTLIHYRKSVFEEIAADGRIDFEICCGRESPYADMRNFESGRGLKVKFIRNLILHFSAKHFICWQLGAIFHTIRTRPQVLVLLGLDPHVISCVPHFLVAKMLGIKVLWWSHATLSRQGRLGDAVRLFFYRWADGILAYDDQGAERLAAAGVRARTMTTVWNCINHEDYRLIEERPSRGHPGGTLRLLYVGRMYPLKKMHLLVEAVAHLKGNGVPVLVDVVGTGPSLDDTRQLASCLHVADEIIFHGELYQEQLADFLRAADLGVVPSWAGLSVIQYFAAGLPVITEENRQFNHPPEVSAVIEGETGYYFEFDSAESLAETILRAQANLDELSRGCTRLVSERFRPEIMKDRMIEGVLKVLGTGSGT